MPRNHTLWVYYPDDGLGAGASGSTRKCSLVNMYAIFCLSMLYCSILFVFGEEMNSTILTVQKSFNFLRHTGIYSTLSGALGSSTLISIAKIYLTIILSKGPSST